MKTVCNEVAELARAMMSTRQRYQQLRAEVVNLLSPSQRAVYRYILLNNYADAAALAAGLHYVNVEYAASVLKELYDYGLLACNETMYTVLD